MSWTFQASTNSTCALSHLLSLSHTHTEQGNTVAHLGKNLSFATPRIKVRMSLGPSFIHDSHFVPWSSGI